MNRKEMRMARMLWRIVLAATCAATTTHLHAQAADTTALAATDTANRQPGFVKRAATSIVNRYFNDSTNPQDPKFLIYPTVAFSPETSWEVGFSSLLLYYARRDTTNRLSEISAFTFVTLRQQYGAWFDHFLYSDKDRWFFLGRLRFQRFPLYYFGVGPEAPAANEQTINANYILIRERILRKVRRNFFIGLETDFQQMSRVTIEAGNSPLPAPLGATGSRNIGLGVGLVYDNRHNVLNVRKGLFAEAAWLQYGRGIGSDFNFRTLNIDTRLFRPMGRQQVLAAQVYGQFMTGQVPFNQLALIGGESLMRGYYLGRFRDKNMLVAQAEYRFLPFPFSKRLGGAVFASAGAVAPSIGAFSMRHVLPAGGAGLRYLLFPKKDIFVRLDLAFTRE
ncbi:MAG: outer membrane protein assembly factor, partial [Chitinophagaceae bacterium]|nr:outer membrane protein assembly factor [Chitinophagaceae bacterium]